MRRSNTRRVDGDHGSLARSYCSRVTDRLPLRRTGQEGCPIRRTARNECGRRWSVEVEAGQTCMGRHGHRARFGSSRANFRETPPAPVAGTRCAIAVETVADETHVQVVFVSGPMALEIFQKGRPAEWNAMLEEILKGEREAMVDAAHRWPIFGKP